jgi:hypothetical protein
MVDLRPEDTYKEPESNGLGLAAFIVALVGFVTGGCLSFVGLIMGLIAMNRRPRGFAIAGVIIGFIGSFAGCIIMAAIFGLLGSFGIAIAAMVFAQIDQGVVAMDKAADVVLKWRADHGNTLPDSSQAAAALKAAGIHAIYSKIDLDEFELRLVIDEGSSDPWVFNGTYEVDGNRVNLNWETGDNPN